MSERLTIVVLLAAVVLLTTGCADFKTYLRNRGNDLADCFTVRAGWEYGLATRVQVTDYFIASAGGSWTNGKAGYYGRMSKQLPSSVRMGLPVFQVLFPIGILTYCIETIIVQEKANRFFDNCYLLFCPLSADMEVANKWARGSFLGLNVDAITGQGEEMIYWKEEEPFLRKRFFIEVGATLGAVGFDVGFNPVEFVDFLLGWFTVDMTGDDAKHQASPEPERQQEPIPPSEQ